MTFHARFAANAPFALAFVCFAFSVGCGHAPIKAEAAARANSSPSLSKQEWCAQVEQFKDSPDWGCTWPPARFAPGDFGPATSIGRYNVIGAVWDEGDTSLAKKMVVRPSARWPSTPRRR